MGIVAGSIVVEFSILPDPTAAIVNNTQTASELEDLYDDFSMALNSGTTFDIAGASAVAFESRASNRRRKKSSNRRRKINIPPNLSEDLLDCGTAECVLSPGVYWLPKSNKKVLWCLAQLDVNGAGAPIARSYQAAQWTTIASTALVFTCYNKRKCSVTVPAGNSLTLKGSMLKNAAIDDCPTHTGAGGGTGGGTGGGFENALNDLLTCSGTCTVAAGEYQLPPSALNSLVLLGKLHSSGSEEAIARSYSTHEWEAVKAISVKVICYTAGCTVLVPGSEAGQFTVTTHVVTRKSTDQEAARMLMQATYGPTKASIQALSKGQSGLQAKHAKDWIVDQMGLTATSH